MSRPYPLAVQINPLERIKPPTESEDISDVEMVTPYAFSPFPPIRMLTLPATSKPILAYHGPNDIFNDNDTTPLGLARSHFWGLKEAKWWQSYAVLGPTRYEYNVMYSPLGLIGRTSRFRIKLVSVVDSVYFEGVALTLILLNSLLMGLDVPDTDPVPEIAAMLVITDLIFMIAFTVEAVMKVLAMGFVAYDGSYLDDPWNRVDFFVVCCAYINLIPGMANATVLRMLRLLRPLRTIGRVPGLRILLSSLINAIPPLQNVFSLIMFVMFLFAIMGMELWSGSFHQRCHAVLPNVTVMIQNVTSLCNPLWGVGVNCNMDTNGVSVPQVCMVSQESRSGLFNYDNLVTAMLQVFIVVKAESWPDVMRRSMETDSFGASLYYIPLFVIGSLICMNIFLAVLKDTYSAEWTARRAYLRTQSLQGKCHLVTSLVPITSNTVFISLLRIPIGVYLSSSSVQAENSDDDGESTVMTASSEEAETPTGSPLPIVSALPPPPQTTFGTLRARLERLVKKKSFGNAFLLIAVYNVVVIATYHDGIDPDFEAFIDQSNFVCNILFACEMLIKLVAIGPREYVRDRFNLIDGALVIVSIPDMAAAGSSAFSVLRTFRVMRIFALARRIKSVQNILGSIVASAKSAAYLSMFMALFIYIMAILGIQLFSNATPTALPRTNFSGLGSALVTVYILVTGDDWIYIMEAYVKATGMYSSALYFIFVVFFGETILLNTFIAILIDAYQRARATRKQLNDPHETDTWGSKYFANLRPPDLFCSEDVLQRGQSMYVSPISSSMRANRPMSPKGLFSESSFSPQTREKQTRYTFPPSKSDSIAQEDIDEVDRYLENLPKECLTNTNINMFARAHSDRIYPLCFRMSELLTWLIAGKHAVTRDHALKIITALEADVRYADRLRCIKGSRAIRDNNDVWTMDSSCDEQFRPFSVLYGKSLNMFGPENKMRVWLCRLVNHAVYSYVTLVVICLSTILLALDDVDADTRPGLRETINVTNYIFGIFFVLEMIAKIIVYGCIFYESEVPETHRKTANLHDVFFPFFQSAINFIDAIVAVTSFAAIFFDQFRVFRCLRSLRFGVRSQRIRMVLSALFQAIPAILNVTFLICFILLIFAVLATQLLAGKLYFCTDPDVAGQTQCVGNFTAVIQDNIFGTATNATQARVWRNSYYNYDDVGSSMITMFVMFIGDGWWVIMFDAMDATQAGLQKETNASPWFAILFILCSVTCTLYIGNLFTTVIIDKFDGYRKKADRSALLTEEQNEWILGLRLSAAIQLEKRSARPARPLSAFCYKVCTYSRRMASRSRQTDLSTIIKSWQNMRPTMVRPKYVLDSFVEVVVVLNIIAMATWHYEMPYELAVSDDIFGYVCLAVYVAEAVLKITAFSPRGYWSLVWNRFDFFILVSSLLGIAFGNDAVQVLRALRVVRLLRLLRQLKTLTNMCRTLVANVGKFVNICLLVVLIFYNFSIVGMQLCGGAKRGNAITQDFNFDDFIHSIFTLFVISSDGWKDVMQECEDSFPGVLGFFMVFMILGSMVCVNLFTATVVDVFNEPTPSANTALFYAQLKMLRWLWAEHDPECTGRIHSRYFIHILRKLQPPMGFAVATFNCEKNYLSSLELEIDAGMHVDYNAVVHALSQKHLRVNADEIRIVQRFVQCPQLSSNSWKIYHYFVVMKVQKKWLYVRFGITKQKRHAIGWKVNLQVKQESPTKSKALPAVEEEEGKPVEESKERDGI